MNIELKKQRNDLLKRTNVLAKITSITTPSRKEVLSKVAAMLGVEETLVVVDNIEQNFGEHICLAYVKVYDDVKTLKELESKFKLKRFGFEEKTDAVKEEASSEKIDAVKEEASSEKIDAVKEEKITEKKEE